MKVYIGVLLLLAMTSYCMSCSCYPETSTEKFCNRDFGAIIHVRGLWGVFGETRVYRIRLVHTWHSRGTPSSPLNPNFLVTARKPHHCGVTLPNGYYGISGGYSQSGFYSYMRTSSCDFISAIPENLLWTFDPPFC